MPTATYTNSRSHRFRGAMWICLILLCVIGAAAVIRRMVALVSPPHHAPVQLAALDEQFIKKRVVTLIHIIPGLILLTLVPFQFSTSFRSRHLRAHRWIGRTVISLGLVVGISAIPLSREPVGGGVEISSIAFFDAFFLIALVKAFVHIRRRELALHREWIIRAMSIALGVATVRPIMGIFFATSPRTGLTPRQFFGIAFWIGFSLTYIAGELWIHYTRSSVPVASFANGK
ncbi:MAG TPA: DUF2306 domain-containing protein [Terriglobales bacterium]|nr:DUF2306 domain-containing protein [Terriglobales bacterium]